MPRLRESAWAHLLCLVLLASCGRTIVLAADALPPDQRAEITQTGGVRIGRVDGVEVGGSRFVVDPGSHWIDLVSRLDAKRVHSALEGVVDEVTCRVEISLEPGERLRISSRLKVGRDRPNRPDVLPKFESEVVVKSSNGEQTRVLGSEECVSELNCQRANLRRVTPAGCD